MKNIIIVIGIILAIIIIITTVFFILNNLGSRDGAVEGDPYLRGYVLDIEANSFLVAQGMEGDIPYDGSLDRLIGDAAYFEVTEKTKFIDAFGEEESFSALNLYDEVEVWPTELVGESYPVQAEAVRVEKTGRILEAAGDDPQEEPPIVISCDESNTSRLGVLRALENNWSALEKDIPQRPSGGSSGSPWHKPYHAQFIGNDALLIAFEDGHSVVVAVVGFDCVGGRAQGDFRVLDTTSVYDFPMEEDKWSELRVGFGDFRHPPNTYSSISVYSDGGWLEIQDWREIGSNIFILGVGHKPKD